MRTCEKIRNRKATAIVELASISVLLVVISMFVANVLILSIGSGIAERSCRDAARMAAEGSSYETALQLAQAAVKGYKGDGYFITSPIVDVASFVYNDYGGSPPVDVSPFVSVSTSCQVHIPAPILVYGLNWGTDNNMTFSKTYVFPIIKTTKY